MAYNFGFHWQQKQNKRDNSEYERINWGVKKKRKKLSKQLRAFPLKTHVMDNEMFDNVKQMITSNDRKDKVIACEIVLNSRMSMNQMNYFILNHLDILLYGVPEDDDNKFTMWSSGPTDSISHSFSSQGTI